MTSPLARCVFIMEMCISNGHRRRCTMGSMSMIWTPRVLGHLLLRSLVCSLRSLICLLRTARFIRALRCAHSFACSLTHSGAHVKEIFVFGMKASISYSFIQLRIDCLSGNHFWRQKVSGNSTFERRSRFRAGNSIDARGRH